MPHSPYIFGLRRLCDITRVDVQHFLADKRKNGFSGSSTHGMWTAISKVLQAAVDWNLLEQNPARGICIGDRAPKTERLYLNPKEVGRLLDSLSEPCRTLVLVAVLTGMRIGEILALRWKAIDLGRGSIQVRETVSERKFGAPKTKSSRRDIPMSQPVLKHFMRSLAAVDKEARRISYSQPVIRLHSIRKTCFAASCDRPARLWDCPSSHGAASGIRMQRSLPKLESQSVRPKHLLAIRTLKRLLMSTRTPSLKHNGVPSTKSLKFCSLMFKTFQWLQKMKRSTN